MNILEKRIDEVFSAHAEVVPDSGCCYLQTVGILRARGGSSASGKPSDDR